MLSNTLRALLYGTVLALFATSCTTIKTTDATHQELATILKLKKSLVTLNYYLKFDNGQPPLISSSHSRNGGNNSFCSYEESDYITDERPLKMNAFLVKSTLAVSGDTYIHPRFIDKITVSSNGVEQDAVISAYASNQSAIFISFERPFKNTLPLEFKPDAVAPYYCFSYGPEDFFKEASLYPFPMDGNMTYSFKTGKTKRTMPINNLIVTADGTPVGLSMKLENSLDHSTWKRSPLSWQRFSTKIMEKRVSKIRDICSNNILRARVSMRSRKLGKQNNYYNPGEEESQFGTELNTLALLLDERNLLVFADLLPQNTARLSGLQLFTEDSSKPITATFTASLKEYGAFTATLDKPIPGAGIPLSKEPIVDFQDTMVLSAQIAVSGDKSIRYFLNNWLTGFKIGWKKHFFPQFAWRNGPMFIFTQDGQLLAMPLLRREKIKGDANSYSRYNNNNRSSLYMPVSFVKQTLANIEANSDSNNIPLSEKEDKLAWFGVELQGLTPPLARANGVLDITDKGTCGGIVTYVYPNSPAAKANIVPGDILLRIFEKGNLNQLRLTVIDYTVNFRWGDLAYIQEAYYDKIPTPWEPLENSFNKLLTNFGIGKECTIEVYHDNEIRKVDFIVEQAPKHYKIAAKFNSKKVGITVKNITFEARRYFRMEPDSPGVIISHIKPGSKASVAGLKPYEIITHVNGTPVSNTDEFKKLIEASNSLRLSVSRMGKSRIVKIDIH